MIFAPLRRVLLAIPLRTAAWRKHLFAPVLLLTCMFLVALPAHGQIQDPSTTRTLQEWVRAVFQLGIILIVLAAAIFIALGAYLYFAAAGNAETAKTGKDYIARALMGLVLGLVAWIILNTINPQFTTLPDPSL